MTISTYQAAKLILTPYKCEALERCANSIECPLSISKVKKCKEARNVFYGYLGLTVFTAAACWATAAAGSSTLITLAAICTTIAAKDVYTQLKWTQSFASLLLSSTAPAA